MNNIICNTKTDTLIDGCLIYTPGECVKYSGPYLSTLGINTNDTLDMALSKIDKYLSKVPPTTSSTTSTSSTSSSSTSSTSSSSTSSTSSSSTSSTSTSTTTSGQSVFRFATVQDAANIYNANVDDYLLTGGNTTSNGLPAIKIQPGFGYQFILDNSQCRKILIKGGVYDTIVIDNPGCDGTSTCPIVITNYNGQVQCRSFTIRGMKYWKLTGKYDNSAQTGDPGYLGHLGSDEYLFSSGTYGFSALNNWHDTAASLYNVDMSWDEQTVPSDYEIEFTEGGNGGFSNLFKSADAPPANNIVMNNVKIHDNYWHDMDSEGIYLGTTNTDPAVTFTNLHVYNNRFLRAGNDGVQFGQLDGNCIIEHNIIHGAVNWRSPFSETQDNAFQLITRNGGTIFRNNIIIGGSGISSYVAAREVGTSTGALTYDNNLFLYFRSNLGGYFGGHENNPNIGPINITNNWFGKYRFLYDQVYSDSRATNTNQLMRFASHNTFNLSNNRYDGSANKTVLYAIEGGSNAVIGTNTNNILDSIPDIQFINYLNLANGFDYLRVERWASKVFNTYGNESASSGVRKGTPIVYAQGDIVFYKSKMYISLQNGNSLIEPTVTAGWDSWWQLVSFTKPNSSTTTIPPDDVRLVSTSFYNSFGIGLTDNPPFDGTTTTSTSTTSTSSSSSSSTSTSTTTTIAPPNKTINVNLFSSSYGSTASNVVGWNDWDLGSNTAPNTFSNLLFADGTSSGISVALNTASGVGFDSGQDNGLTYGGSICPPSVLRSALRTTYGSFSGNGYIDINITGLNTGKLYSFEFIGSRSSSVGSNSSIYRVDASTTITSAVFVTDDNLMNSIFINDMQTSTGSMILRIRKSTGVNGYINAIRIYDNLHGGPTTTTTSTTTTSSSTSSSTTSSTSSTSSTSTSSTSTQASGPASYTIKGPYSGSQQMWVYEPSGSRTNRSLLIFFHGAGQVGTNINDVNSDGLAQLINAGQVMNSYVCCPQTNNAGGWTTTLMKSAYDFMVANYSINLNKVYVTGLSLGSTGASDFARTYPNLVAAYSVSSGTYGSTSGDFTAKKDIPVWFHHGSNDSTQNSGNTAGAMNVMNQLIPKPKFPPLCSYYYGLGHVSQVWNTNFYNKATARYNFEDWLLLHSLIPEDTATNYVNLAQTTLEINDYRRALDIVNTLSASSTKSALLSQLTVIKTSIDGSKVRYLVGFNDNAPTGNVNAITSQTVGTTISNLVAENGAGSTIGFTVVSSLGGSSVAVPGVSNRYFGLPADGYGNAFGIYQNGGQVKFTGLDNSHTYNVRFYTSDDDYQDIHPLTLTAIIGTTAKYLYNAYCTKEWIEFDNITPISGEIIITLRAKPTITGSPTRDTSGAYSISTSGISGYTGNVDVTANLVTLLDKGATGTTTTSSTSTTSTSTSSSSSTSSTSTTTTTLPFSSAVAKFNFALDGTGSGTPSGWVPAYGNPNVAVVNITDTGQNGASNTGISLNTVSTSGTYWGPVGGNTASNINGATIANPSFVFPTAVTASYWFTQTAYYQPGVLDNYNIVLGGLIPGATYKIEILGSREASGITTSTRLMTIACKDNFGIERNDNYDVKGNTVTLQTFTSKTPTSSGNISLALYRKSDTLDGNMVLGYINGMIVTRLT